MINPPLRVNKSKEEGSGTGIPIDGSAETGLSTDSVLAPISETLGYGNIEPS
jgi:hypothetical protein